MPFFRFLALLAALAAASVARAEPTVWQAQYPLAPTHPVVAEGWAPMAEAMQPDLDLQLRLIGPRLGTPEAVDALSLGTHQMGMVALASYPDEFPYWAMLSELFLVGGESLAAAAAITELVMAECPPCQLNFARRKLVFLGTYGAAPYVLIAPHPMTESHSLEGQTVATPGSLWDRLVQNLGATAAPVIANPRAALVEGQATALIDIAEALRQPPLAGHAVAVTKLPLGGYRGAGPFMINRDAWRSLSDDQRRRMFAAAAGGIVRITQAYHRKAAADLAAASAEGIPVAPGTLMLQDRIRRFATTDQARVIVSAETRFGIADAEHFLTRLKALYDKYAILLGPDPEQADAITLLTSEIFDRLDVQTYGLR
jgi:TRAP-type C4-dicarboxylate transport system substrate-binding protein